MTPAKIVIAASPPRPAGARPPAPDREIIGVASPDGSFTGSLGMTLAPGTYDVNIALLDPASGKGCVANVPVTVTDPASTGRRRSRPSP